MKICPSFNGYSVTEDGKVFSHIVMSIVRPGAYGAKHGVKYSIDLSSRRELKQRTTKKGYKVVHITTSPKKGSLIEVQRLVADAFLGPVKDGLQVIHINGDQSDNRAVNIAYGEPSKNQASTEKSENYLQQKPTCNSKLTNGQALEVRRLRKNGEPVHWLAIKFNVSASVIESIIYNRKYKIKEG